MFGLILYYRSILFVLSIRTRVSVHNNFNLSICCQILLRINVKKDYDYDFVIDSHIGPIPRCICLLCSSIELSQCMFISFLFENTLSSNYTFSIYLNKLFIVAFHELSCTASKHKTIAKPISSSQNAFWSLYPAIHLSSADGNRYSRKSFRDIRACIEFTTIECELALYTAVSKSQAVPVIASIIPSQSTGFHRYM